MVLREGVAQAYRYGRVADSLVKHVIEKINMRIVSTPQRKF